MNNLNPDAADYNNQDGHNISDNIVVITDIDDRTPCLFPEPFQKENLTFMRLLRRLKQQEEFRNFETPQIDEFIWRFPVYGAYESQSFRRAFVAVKEWFQQCK